MTADERAITEINSGIYAFDLAGLYDAVQHRLEPSNAAQYLDDLVSIYRERERPVETVTVTDSAEILA